MTHPTAPPPDILGDLWRTLADQSGRKHWHGGPNPCRVCGGIADPPRPKRLDMAARFAALRETTYPDDTTRDDEFTQLAARYLTGDTP